MSTEPKLRTRFLLIVLAVAVVTLVGAAGVYWWAVYGLFGNGVIVERPKKLVTSDGGKPGGDVWIQDFAAAKEKAAREKKDILLSFEGSDWCIWCERMDKEIFDTPAFLEKAPAGFVLVKVDFPQHEPAKAKVRDAAANERLQQQYGVGGSYPAVRLTDAQGEVFGGVNGFMEGGAGQFLMFLEKGREMRAERDKVLAEVDKQEGAAKLPAAKQASQFLMQRGLLPTLRRQAPVWLELAKLHDPNNRDGYLEQFFEFDWYYRLEKATKDQLPTLLDEVVEWRKKHGDFKDKERAAILWMELAKIKSVLEDYQGAFACLDEGLKLQPKDQFTRQQLQNGPLALGLGTGTAFAVSSSGHFLTNAHVAGGPGKVFLQLPGQKGLTPAQVVAEKVELDLALLKIDAANDPNKALKDVKPLPIAGDHVPRRGEEVAVWGFPLGTTFGAGLKLTKGVISALPEPGTRNMLLLDLRINPGNSGSPLCDGKGNVIGIVTARSQFFGAPSDSYGMALPGKDVHGFLSGLDIKSSAKSGTELLPWDEIDRRVSAAVAMVIKARRMEKKGI